MLALHWMTIRSVTLLSRFASQSLHNRRILITVESFSNNIRVGGRSHCINIVKYYFISMKVSEVIIINEMSYACVSIIWLPFIISPLMYHWICALGMALTSHRTTASSPKVALKFIGALPGKNEGFAITQIQFIVHEHLCNTYFITNYIFK